MIPGSFFKNVCRAALAVSGAAALAAGVLWNARAALAVVTGAEWMFVNLFFLFKFIEKPKTFLFAVIKFPVLYLAGFFILRSGFFSAAGLLAGLTAVMAAFVGVWTRGRLCTA